MTPSPVCVALVKQFEQCRLVAFKPTPEDVWTCGWGATGPDIGPDTVWTQAQADARFASDLANFSRGVNSAVTSLTTQAQFDAMVSFSFNVGMTAFEDSTLLRLHNASDYADVPPQFLRWDHQAGQVLTGLLRRRQAEAALYQGNAA